MASKSKSKKLYYLATFLLVSALCAVLVTGLALPMIALAGGAAKATASSMKYLPNSFVIPQDSSRSTVYMADGSVLAEFYDENRIVVPLDKISPLMRQAQIAIEDHRFYNHGAIDPKGTARALVSNLFGGDTQGGSTLTQQYVKLVRIETAKINNDEVALYKAQEPTILRKIVEMRYAVALEKELTKDQILERYLNLAYYGDGAYGVEAAARHYFGTTAEKLTLDQAAMLAGLVQNPTNVNPVSNTKAAIDRRNHVLDVMELRGVITAEQRDAAKAVAWDPKKVVKSIRGCISSRYPFICDYIERTLINGNILGGGNPTENRNLLYRGGYKIQTAIDPEAQDEAENAIKSLVDPKDPVIANVVLLDSKTGMIISMAQSRPKMGNNVAEGETYWNYNVSRKMGGAEGYQAGSTFKTFTMAAALASGMSTRQRYTASSPMEFKGKTFKSCQGTFVYNQQYLARNSTGHSTNIDMMEAAQWSVNTYFLQLAQNVGLCETVKMAQSAGAERADGKDFIKDSPYYDYVPSFTLGTVEVTPLSMANAYATFANRGKRCQPTVLKSVTTHDNVALKLPENSCSQVIDEKVADGVNYVLKSVVDRGTGTPAKISNAYDMAGKTGTTDDAQSVWFAGYTPEVTGVAMLAIDKTHSYWKNHKKSLSGLSLPYSKKYLTGSGSGDAGRIFKSAMSKALTRYTPTKFTKPPVEITEGKLIPIPNVSGMSASQAKAVLLNAGFNVVDSQVDSTQPKGTYLGVSHSGQARSGQTIYLKFSKGPETASPSPSPSPNP